MKVVEILLEFICKPQEAMGYPQEGAYQRSTSLPYLCMGQFLSESFLQIKQLVRAYLGMAMLPPYPICSATP